MSEITATVNADLANSEQWLADRENLLSCARNIDEVETPNTLDNSGAIYTAIGKHIKRLESERKKITGPIDKLKKSIMAQEKEMRAELISEHARLKSLNDAYATKLAKEERERLEQQERELMHKKLAEVDAHERFGFAAQVGSDDITAEESECARKLTDNRLVKRWEYKVSNHNKIPREFLIPDEKKIRAAIKYAENMELDPEIPGIEFTSRVSVEGK